MKISLALIYVFKNTDSKNMSANSADEDYLKRPSLTENCTVSAPIWRFLISWLMVKKNVQQFVHQFIVTKERDEEGTAPGA